jgi:hypothetical protein
MQRVIKLLVLLLLSGAAACPALAVEPAKSYIRLWNLQGNGDLTGQTENFLSLDIVPGTAGLELVGAATKDVPSSRDANHYISFTETARFEARAVNGGAVVFSPKTLPSVTSAKFPDPTDAQFQCGGKHETHYSPHYHGGGNAPCPCSPNNNNQQSCFTPGFDQFPGTFNVGLGIGNVGTKRVFVFGNAVTGSYWNNQSNKTVDITNFIVSVYDLSGNRLWFKSFAATTAQGQLEPVLCGVAAFHTTGTDEVRIAYVNDNKFTYQFYNLLTGALTSTVAFTTANP